MQRMRDVLRSSLGRSLRDLTPEDRLAVAWRVVCGEALAVKCEVESLDNEGVLHVRVLQPGWRDQFIQMRAKLTEELRRIADVRLQTIHFEGQGSTRARGQDAEARVVKGSVGRPTARPRKEQRRSS